MRYGIYGNDQRHGLSVRTGSAGHAGTDGPGKKRDEADSAAIRAGSGHGCGGCEKDVRPGCL